MPTDDGGGGGDTPGQAGAVGNPSAGTNGNGQSGTSGGSGGSPGGHGGASGGGEPPAALLPCDVAEVFENYCAACHKLPLAGGAPMPLISHDNIHSPASMGQTLAQRIAARIHDAESPMPPEHATPMPEADRAILDAWLAADAPAGDPGCPVEVVSNEPPERPLPPDAVCYELLVHGQPVPNDTTPYTVPLDEHYANFYFDVPWTEPSVMVRWRTLYDNTEVLHHWLFYKTDRPVNDGYFEVTIGSHLFANLELIAGWAVGGNDMELPEGIAAKMPSPGGKMMIEWHYYNSTGQVLQDKSGIEVCVVPERSVDPAKVSGITWTGTEFIAAPPGTTSKAHDACTPSFDNVPEGEPIRIFAFNPHMHNIGSHMRTWILRADSSVDLVFDRSFRFDHQVSYRMDPMIELYRGDRIVSECTFNNTTSGHVGFGPSSTQEMCYQFAFSYPAGALDNGAPSLTGASNTCWDTPFLIPPPPVPMP
jgi:hypothetical protein